jgi:hypothetical protein
VLTTDTETPVVTKTTVRSDLLQTFQIFTELAVDTVRDDLGILAIGDIALSVKEPSWYLVLSGILNDGDNTFEFFGSDFTGTVIDMLSVMILFFPFTGEISSHFAPLALLEISPICLSFRYKMTLICHIVEILRTLGVISYIPLVQIDIGLLADQVGVTTSDTLNTGQSVHNLLFAIDVGVQ